MRVASLFCVAPLAYALAIPAAAGVFSSYNAATCGEFLRSSGDLSMQFIASNYVRGYVSAHNAYNQGHQISRELPNATVVAYVEKFCRENPLSDVSIAAAHLVVELGGRRIPK